MHLRYVPRPLTYFVELWLQVLVVGFLVDTTDSLNLKNVALNKPAVLSTLYEPAPYVARAEFAVDGNTDKTDLWEYSCAHTSDSANPPSWWIVDLLRIYEIHKVLVTNRDTFIGRLRFFYIELFDTHPNTIPGFPNISGKLCHYETSFPGASETATYNCGSPVTGRYLRIIKYQIFSLVFCEVQVMAVDSPAFYAKRQKGKSANIYPFKTLSLGNYLRCATWCGQHGDCNAFSWNRVTRVCGLLKVSPYSTPLWLSNDPDIDFTSDFSVD